MGTGFLNNDKVQAAQIGFSTEFNTAFNALRALDSNEQINFWKQLSMEIPATQKITQLNWLGALPQFEEWKDTRKLSQLRNDNYQVRVKKWAAGIRVDMDDIEDDALGIYLPQISMLPQMSYVHRMNLMVDFLVSGFATTKYGACYDGQAFFSTAHKDGNGSTWSNFVHHTLDDAGALDEAIQTMMQVIDENGEPMYSPPTHLIVGPTNRANANTAVLADRLASGASNTNFKVVQVVVSPKITDGKWFLASLSNKAMKPLIFQMRRDLRFRIQGMEENEQSDDRFMKDIVKFGADARYNVAYGLPQVIVGSDATT
jgi:phage major head subunit gpT-like protein